MIDKSIVLMGERYVIRWMRYRNSFPAYEYLRGLADADRVEARFRALAAMFADNGRLPSDTHGHWLSSPFETLFEFKPFGHRLIGFEDGSNFYVAYGAPKRNKKAQNGDYQTAENLRQNFLVGIASKTKKGGHK